MTMDSAESLLPVNGNVITFQIKDSHLHHPNTKILNNKGIRMMKN